MRSVTDFTQAIETLVGQAVTQCSAEQLEAIGNILMGLGSAALGSAALKRAGIGQGHGAPAFAPCPESLQPVSGGMVAPVSPAPAPTQLPGVPSQAQPVGSLLPTYTPPPENVHCEEAHRQRHEGNRISGLRADSVVFCEQVFYYLNQIGATANTIPEDDPLCGAKIDEIMLSIECLPGTRPGGGEDHIVLQVWSNCYQVMKDLVDRKLLDHDDEQQILHKLGDRPGGAMADADYSNKNLKSAPKPGLVTVTQMVPEQGASGTEVPPQPTPAPMPAPTSAPASALDASPPPPLPTPPPPPSPTTGEGLPASMKFGKETIDIPADQGHVPPTPAQPPSKPVALPPGSILILPGQSMQIPLPDGPRQVLNDSKLSHDTPLVITSDMMSGEKPLPMGVVFIPDPEPAPGPDPEPAPGPDPDPESAPAAADQPSDAPSS